MLLKGVIGTNECNYEGKKILIFNEHKNGKFNDVFDGNTLEISKYCHLGCHKAVF